MMRKPTSFFIEDKKKDSVNWLIIIPTWTLAIIALGSLWITHTNVELANRPFVSIENVYWRPEGEWFISGFRTKNYGNKPAQEYSLRNVRAIILILDKDALIEKEKQEKGPESEHSPYFQEWVTDKKNKICWGIGNLLADYFYDNPEADKSAVENLLKSLNETLPENSILKYNNRLLISIYEVNNDMFDYFKKTSTLVYPNQEYWRRYDQQMGLGGMEAVKNGDNFLIVYWSTKYKGLVKRFSFTFPFYYSPIYSTNYVGYHLNPKMSIDETGHPVYLLRELKSWSKTE